MSDRGPSPDAVVWAAQQIVRQHMEPPDPDRATGRCAKCTPSGCPLLYWARDVLGRVDPRLVAATR
jgi:hypothetical protein